MPKTRRSNYIFLSCFFFFLLLCFNSGKAQDAVNLISVIQQLEKTFNVKFSYADSDVSEIVIVPTSAEELDSILEDIQQQTQLTIKKLNKRYYTISYNDTVTICGQVLDNYGNNTIPGATIELLGTKTAVVTDESGMFQLQNVPKKATIQIRFLGFKTQFITAKNLSTKPCSRILMAENFQQLSGVIVYQFLTTGLAKKADASILLNTKDFGILPGLIEPDVLQTAQALPGIKSVDESVSNINIRGGTNDQNLILWDGIKMYQSGHFFGLMSAFNPYLTDKITITKNGTSAQYGDGVSGILDMQTKNALTSSYFGGAGFNLINGDVFAQFPIAQNLAFQFSARRSVTDFFDTPTYEQFYNRVFQDSEVFGRIPENTERKSDFFFHDFTAKVLYNLSDNHKVRFSFITINNDLKYAETAEDPDNSTNSNLNQFNLSFGGSLESTWNNNFSTFVNGYYTNYELDSENSTFSDSQQLQQNNKVVETALKVVTKYNFSNHLNWLNGYQFNEVGIANFTNVSQPPFKSNIKGVNRTHSLFSELSYFSENEKLFARGGVRFNRIENLETFQEFLIEPRINVNYELLEDFKIEALGEFKSQSTNQIIDLEQNFLGIEKRRWILSDGNQLPVTKSKQGAVGFNIDKRKIYVGIEGFYKEVKGVNTLTQGFQNQNQFNGEVGQYNVKGVEFLVNQKNNNYSVWLSYTYNVNNYTFKDITPPTFPNNLDIRHTVTFAGTYTYNNIKLGVGINYRTGTPFTEPLEEPNSINTNVFPNTINYKEPNSGRLPQYLRADASAIYNFEISERIKASLGISVLNVFGRENILNKYYQLNEANEIKIVENVSLGLTPNASFRVSF